MLNIVSLKSSLVQYVAFVLFSSCKLTINENSLAIGRLQSTQQLCQNKGRLKRFVELQTIYILPT